MKAYPPRERALEPYELYLRTRWMAGCHNGVGLYREIVAQGFTGSRIGVATFVAQLRRDDPYPGASSRPGLTVPDVAALLFTHPRTADEDALLNVVAGAHRDLAALITIGDRWMEMVGTRQGVHCDQWRTDATGSAAKYSRQCALNLKKRRAGRAERLHDGVEQWPNRRPCESTQGIKTANVRSRKV